MTKKNSLYSVRGFAISAGKAAITPAEIANILGKQKCWCRLCGEACKEGPSQHG